MTNNEELELFKKAYSGFRERGEMPFPDQVFNEFLRLRGDFSLDNGCLKKGDMVVRDYLKLSPVYKVSRIDGDKVFCSHHSNTKEYCFYHHHLRKATKKEVETSIK